MTALFKSKDNTKESTEEPLTTEKIYEEGVARIQDIIAPAALQIDAGYLRLGKKFARTLFILSYPRSLSTNWFSPVINFSQETDIALFVSPIDSSIALKNLRKRTAEVESQILTQEEKGQVRDPMLEAAYRNIEDLRDRLQQAQEKLFNFGLYITIYGNSIEELDTVENELRALSEGKLLTIKGAMFEQREGFTSTLPFACDQLQITTRLNTEPISSLFPFVSFDLTSGEGILYGINRHNNSLVLFDRFSLENANTVIFGKSGGGKSYLAKTEILRLLMTGVDIIVIDPENEYQYLAEAVGGSFIKISLGSEHHINPFDLPVPGKDEQTEDILRSNIINLVGLLRIMLGGLTPEEDAIMDRALTEAYGARDITPEADFSQVTPPLMEDLQTVLESMEGGEHLAVRLQKYTQGTYANFLNRHSNVEMDSNLVVFNIRDMEEELRPIAMYIILRYIWNKIRSEIKKRVLLVDEAWWIMQHDDGASFLYGIAKRARKYDFGLTTITQDVDDFMKSKYGQPIISNSSIQIILKQSPSTIDTTVKTFNLTEEEKFLLLEAAVGEGLFFAGTKHVAIKVVASYTEDQIITSDPEQVLQIQQAREAMKA